MDAALLDIDAIAAEVAAEVGLAEGTSGVRDILRLIMLTEPVPTGQLSRQAELPVPIVTAVCNELRKLSVVDRSRPVRLTERARAALGPAGPRIDPACDRCGGLRLPVPAARAPAPARYRPALAGARGTPRLVP